MSSQHAAASRKARSTPSDVLLTPLLTRPDQTARPVRNLSDKTAHHFTSRHARANASVEHLLISISLFFLGVFLTMGHGTLALGSGSDHGNTPLHILHTTTAFFLAFFIGFWITITIYVHTYPGGYDEAWELD